MEQEDLGRRTSASTSCENRKRLSTITREFPVLQVSTFRYRKPISLISIPTPLKDFITFEMEKERLDGSSPRGVLDNCTRSLGSESDSSKTSTSDSEGNPTPRVTIQCRGFLRLFKSRSMRRQTSLPAPPVNVPKMSKKSSRSMREKPAPSLKPPQELDFCYLKSSWKIFSLSELQAATKNFSSENMIGKGGYAEVYKGCLQDGQLVAIKRLTRGTLEERTGDFLSEIGIIVHVNHRNTAKLIGYGVEGGLHLVLQLSPHGSLASLLHGSKNVLEWGIRYKVALGTAEGLRYLHESCQRRIIHRDIKAANILLTEDFEPQISDFGLSKWLPEQWSHHTVLKFEGTFGYLAPEYFMHGIVDEKTDVFAFGVLLLELITGRRAIDNTQQSLVMWAKPLLDKNDIRELVDPALGDAYDSKQMNRMAMTASLCIQHSSILRPRMSQVVQLLRSEETGSDSLKQCRKPFLHRTYSELFDSEEYNLTRYLNDMNRHKQIALEF